MVENMVRAPSPSSLADEQMIERVARALCREAHIEAYGGTLWRAGELDIKIDRLWSKWRHAARISIEAMRECSNEPSQDARGTARHNNKSPCTDGEVERDPARIIAEARDVADWIERTKPQGLLYDSAMPTLREAADLLTSLSAEREALNHECELSMTTIAEERARAERAAAERDALKARVERLGSTEAFVVSRSIDPDRDAELVARIDFARSALAAADGEQASIPTTQLGGKVHP